MANFNLVVDTSNFKPFDISPAMQILHDYRDAYYRLEDQINKIAEEKGQYVLPDTPENQEYRNIMNKYNTDYDAVVDDFSRGMNTENARRIRDIRRRYHSEVSPINKAIEAYNKDLDKMVALGADAIVGNRKRSIRDYYGGINPGIEYRSDKTIQEVAAGVMQGLDNALLSAPAKVGDIAKQYFVLKQKGLDGATALGEILKHDPQLNSQQGAADTTQLINALEKVYQHYAFKEGTPENEDIWTSVVNGALKGIQAPKYQLQVDHSYESPSAIAAKEQAQEYKNVLKAQRIAQMEDRGYIYDEKTDTFKYDEEEAKRRAKARTVIQPRDPKPTPHITYNGKQYGFTADSDGDITMIYDLATGDVVDDATRDAIIDAQAGLADKTEDTTPPKPSGTPWPPKGPSAGQRDRSKQQTQEKR